MGPMQYLPKDSFGDECETSRSLRRVENELKEEEREVGKKSVTLKSFGKHLVLDNTVVSDKLPLLPLFPNK